MHPVVLYYFNPQKTNEVFFARQSYHSHFLNLYFYDIVTHEFCQKEISNLYIVNDNQLLSNIVYNELDNSIILPCIKDKIDIYLLIIDLTNRDYSLKKVYSFQKLYKSLRDTVHTVNSIRFYKPLVTTKQNKLIKYKDGYRFELQKPLYKSLFSSLVSYTSYFELHENQYYSYLSDLLNDTFNGSPLLDSYDVYEIIHYFNRNDFTKNKYFRDCSKELIPTSQMKILAQEDINNDGFDELLIVIEFDRYIPSYMFCYDTKKDSIVWMRDDYKLPGNFYFIDINNDDQKEIIFSTYSPCIEPPIDYDGSPEKVFHKSYFVILNNDGTNVNDQHHVLSSIPGFYEYTFAPVKGSSKIVLGMKSRYDSSEKPFLVYDYHSKEIDTLNYYYHNIESYAVKDGHNIFFDIYNDRTAKIDFNTSLSVVNKKTFDYAFKILKHQQDGTITINDECMYFTTSRPVKLINDDMDVIFEFNHGFDEHRIQVHNDAVYFIERIHNDSYLSGLTFSKTWNINLFAVILLLSELLILFIYLVLKQVLSVPITSTRENYFVINSFFGILYVWRLNGVYSRLFKLPRRVSFHKATAYKFLYDISDKVQEFYSHSALFIKTKVYKIHTENEFSIIQRISHDLKNQILMIKLQIDEYYNGLKKKKSEKIGYMLDTIKDISQVAQTLSNFSQINKLYKEKTGIVSLCEEILAELYSHDKIDDVKLSSDQEYILEVDKKLLKSALKNLICNALDAVVNGQEITIEISQVDHVVSIIIKNPTTISKSDFENVEELGYTNKKKGSGLGLPIARSVVEKHDGKFQILLKDGYFIVEIFLPYTD